MIRNKTGFVFTVLFLFIWFYLTGYSLSGKPEEPPLKAYTNLSIPNGEFLRYSAYWGKDKISDFYIVTLIQNGESGKEALVYQDGTQTDQNRAIPDNYTNYSMKFRISLFNGFLLESSGGSGTNRPSSSKRKGAVSWNYYFDPVSNAVTYKSVFWDGYEAKDKVSHINIRQDYPAWDASSGAFLAPRYLDFTQPGNFLFVVPDFLKDPIPISLKVIGKEDVTNQMSIYHTFKVGFWSDNAVLRQMAGTYLKEIVYWVEDNPRKLIVKMSFPGGNILLEAVSNVGQSNSNRTALLK